MFGRLNKLEEKLAKLERKVDDRDLDWVDMRARCKRLLDRTEKAARVVTEATTAEEPANGSPPSTPSTGFLSDRQKLIQQQIMRRRGGM